MPGLWPSDTRVVAVKGKLACSSPCNPVTMLQVSYLWFWGCGGVTLAFESASAPVPAAFVQWMQELLRLSCSNVEPRGVTVPCAKSQRPTAVAGQHMPGKQCKSNCCEMATWHMLEGRGRVFRHRLCLLPLLRVPWLMLWSSGTYQCGPWQRTHRCGRRGVLPRSSTERGPSSDEASGPGCTPGRVRSGVRQQAPQGCGRCR